MPNKMLTRDQFEATMESVRQELENIDAMERDAKRYRWLRAQNKWIGLVGKGGCAEAGAAWSNTNMLPDEIDAAIDAQMVSSLEK